MKEPKLLYRGQEVKVQDYNNSRPMYMIIHPASRNGVIQLYHEGSPYNYCGSKWITPLT
jgi:hypothetical protein